MESINPTTGTLIESLPVIDDDELENRLQRSATAFAAWRTRTFAERATLLNRAAVVLEEHKERYATSMTREMGKPIGAARAEVEKCAWVCRFYAERAAGFLSDEPLETGDRIIYQPLGAILAVMPWNFPFWQLFRFAAPALMAGNTVLLKHASNVPRCALEIESVFELAGFDAGEFQTLLIESARVAQVLDDRRVAAVTLTGSTAAGRAVAAEAGRRIKKSVLELGGSDPFIVMPSAEMDSAVETAVNARMINNGQSCIAAKRFILHREIAASFTDAFVRRMNDLRVGDPMDESTDLGPLATEALRDELAYQVERSIAAGAKLLTGGDTFRDRDGWFYPPTVLDGIPENTPAWSEEMFGPVASIFTVNDAADAVRVANTSDYGLGASVWTHDEMEKDYFTREIAAGAVFVNRMVASDPRIPFGGIKLSGYGRELSFHGIREFVNIKSVVGK